MPDKVMLGKYYPNSSIIHSLNPLTKILILFSLCLMTIVNSSIFGLLMIILISLSLISMSKIPIFIYFNTLKTTSFILFIFGFAYFLITHNIIMTLMVVIELICLLFILILLVMTTSLTEITYGLELFLKPLQRFKVKVNVLSLKITNFLRFVPIYLDNKERLVKKFKNHGIIVDNNRLNLKFNIVKRAYRLAKKQLNQTNKMMDVRLYSIKEYRTNFRLNKFGVIDSIMVFLNIVILIMIVVSEVI
ncbi:MAG: energy-coupling factor transporter transmembrane protein EcfT [Bacilli bacterium]